MLRRSPRFRTDRTFLSSRSRRIDPGKWTSCLLKWLIHKDIRPMAHMSWRKGRPARCRYSNIVDSSHKVNQTRLVMPAFTLRQDYGNNLPPAKPRGRLKSSKSELDKI